jgi:DNA-binding NarL/FixJ family response regulator
VTGGTRARLVLADDHPIVLHGLEQLFERQPDFEVVRCCSDGSSALEAVRELSPDVLVLDLRMPSMSGVDVLRALSAAKLKCRTVVLTAALRDRDAVDALQFGARGLVLKESAPELLLECVRRVHEGNQWLDPEALSGAVGRILRRDAAIREAAGILTPREVEIVGLVVEGKRNKEIAERLSITEGTVKLHLHHIYDKLGVSGRLELVVFAQERGLA